MVNNTSTQGGRAESGGEFAYGEQIGTALIDGFTFLGEPVQYVVIDGHAIFEGDINLGPVEQVETALEMLRADVTGEPAPEAIVITPGSQFGWPDCTIPYQIDSSLPDQDRVTDAVAHWQEKTDFTFVRRTSANDNQFSDFVEFVPGSGCSSYVGRRGGRQTITLSGGCSTGNAIHEIGHAAGLWHEQSRADRDNFVTILWENIQPNAEHNFSQHITDGDDVGAYDYGSIMHYPRNAFSRNGKDTIVPTDPNAKIGQRVELSSGDIRAINRVLCPTVPHVRELTLSAAVRLVHQVGLVPRQVGKGTGSPDPIVWRQSPRGGQQVDRGSTVTLHVQSGPLP